MWLTGLRSRFKKIVCCHHWERNNVLVEQFFVGGFYAWQKCSECKRIKFAKADANTPQEPGWEERKAAIEAIMRT